MRIDNGVTWGAGIPFPHWGGGRGEAPTGNGLLSPHFFPDLIEAGCDEAGRGCLAGSVFAAAVILPKDYANPEFNDSKQLSEKKRYALREQIIRDAVAWAVGIVTPEEIDKINILHASFLAMHRAIDQLAVRPEALIIDGNRFDPYKPISQEPCAGRDKRVLAKPDDPDVLPYQCIVKGDAKYQSIAAASILAKTFRDDYMDELHLQYPMYDWNNNKGYPTRKHREAIARYGITPFHRKSYHLLGNRQLELNFDEE
jgi:ribonuclease HII